MTHLPKQTTSHILLLSPTCARRVLGHPKEVWAGLGHPPEHGVRKWQWRGEGRERRWHEEQRWEQNRKPELRIAGEGGVSLGPTHPLVSHLVKSSSSINRAKVDLRRDVKSGLWRSRVNPGSHPRPLSWRSGTKGPTAPPHSREP